MTAEPVANEAPVERPSEKTKVIYVMGAGRSGSTILGVALGNCRDVFYAGELDAWLPRSGVPQLGGPERERFWGGVRERLAGDAATLFGNRAQRCIERSMAVFRVHLWPARRRMRERYLRVAEELYAAIADVAGVGHIVDSSHYPLRARELQRLAGVELHLVYLVRDPQSVVGSFRRKDVAQYSKSPLTTNAYLWLTNLLAVPVFLRHRSDRRMLLRYEDFTADPAGVVRDILDRVGVSAEIPDMSSLSTGLPFQGNRVIRSSVVALGGGSAPPARVSPMTALLQLPWSAVLSRLAPRAASGAPSEHSPAAVVG